MPIRKDSEGRWHAEVCVDRRRLHRRCQEGASASDAKRLESELRRALDASRRTKTPTVPGNPLLTELMADYTERHAETLRSADTARYHAYRIHEWIEGKRASEVRAVAAQIIEDLLPAYAPATINRSLGTLKKALRVAWERERTTFDYSGLVKRLPEHNQRDVTLTIDQVHTLASHASENVGAAIWIALFTGCRRGELLKIKAADIGETEITIRAGNTKTLKTRTVPIVAPLRPWLSYLPLQITFEGLKSGFQRARVAADMAHVTFHDLRRSAATILLANGAPMHVISKMLGHSSTRVTEERYAHLAIDDLRASMEAAFSPNGGR